MKYKMVIGIIFALFIIPIFKIADINNLNVDLNSSLNCSSTSWDPKAIPVCTNNGTQLGIKTCSDGNGGVIMAWSDYRNGNGHYEDIYAQLINDQGICPWNANGVAICTAYGPQGLSDICSDQNGGAIIVWQDERNTPYDIYAQRVDAVGNIYWDINGVMIGTNNSYEFRPQLCSDGMGGAIITWNSHQNDTSSVHAQRIGEYGTLLWTPGGVEITKADNDLNITPKICVDNMGGAIIVWDDYRGDSNPDIYGQHINSNGITQWTSNGKLICSAINSQTFIKLCKNPIVGAYLAWQDFRNIDTTSSDIYAQRINLDGDILWSTNGVPVCTVDDYQTNIELCLDYQGGLIVTWEDDRENERHIYAQRVDAGGTISWLQDGVRICSASSTQENQKLCTNGTNGVFITWSDSRGTIYAQKLTTDGKIIGNSNGYLICNSDYSQRDPDICLSADDTVIIAWEDYRNLNGDIYAQRLDIELYIPSPQNGIPLGPYYLVVLCISLLVITYHTKKKLKLNHD